MFSKYIVFLLVCVNVSFTKGVLSSKDNSDKSKRILLNSQEDLVAEVLNLKSIVATLQAASDIKTGTQFYMY